MPVAGDSFGNRSRGEVEVWVEQRVTGDGVHAVVGVVEVRLPFFRLDSDRPPDLVDGPRSLPVRPDQGGAVRPRNKANPVFDPPLPADQRVAGELILRLSRGPTIDGEPPCRAGAETRSINRQKRGQPAVEIEVPNRSRSSQHPRSLQMGSVAVVLTTESRPSAPPRPCRCANSRRLNWM